MVELVDAATILLSVAVLVITLERIRTVFLSRKAELHQEVSMLVLELDRFFAQKENVELKRYFYLNKELPTEAEDPTEYLRIVNVAEMVIDTLEMIAITIDGVRGWHTQVRKILQHHDGYIQYILLYSPAIRQFYYANKNWYKSLAGRVRRAEKELAYKARPATMAKDDHKDGQRYADDNSQKVSGGRT